MNNLLTGKLKRKAFSFGLGFLLIMIIFRIISDIIKGYSRESWQITEWLINYQGGFVRRGLPGEVIFQVSSLLNISPYYIIIILSLLIYGCTAIILVKLFNKRGYRLFPLFSPLLLGMPVFSFFWVRKDVMLILIFIVCLILLKKRFKGRLFLLNFFICIAILSHESFAFWGLGSIFFLLIENKTLFSFRTFLPVLKLIPAWICAGACFIYSGNHFIAETINKSWENSYFPFYAEESDGDTAIDALGWTLSEGLNYSFSTFTTFSDGFIYAPLVWLFTIGIFVILLYIYMVIPAYVKRDSEIRTTVDASFLKYFILQGILVLPLFILGLDYGRWMFLWGVSAISLMLLSESKIPFVDILLDKFSSTDIISPKERFFHYINSRNHLQYMDIGVLALGIPHCAWSIHHYILTTPLFQPIMVFKRILIDKLMLF